MINYSLLSGTGLMDLPSGNMAIPSSSPGTPAANQVQLTNIAQTWGQTLPFSSGIIRLAGKQIWSSDFYSVTQPNKQFDADNPASPVWNLSSPPVVGQTFFKPTVQAQEKLMAIDVAYSFGIEAIPSSKRILKKLRIDGVTVYDINNPEIKFSFDIHYGDNSEQDKTIRAAMGDDAPYYPDQVYIVIWGLVAPIPKDIDAEFTMIAGTFDANHLVGKQLPPVIGTGVADYAAREYLTYDRATHTVRVYDIDSLELKSGPTVCAPTSDNKLLNQGMLVFFAKLGVFAAVESDNLSPFLPLHVYDLRTGQLRALIGSRTASGPGGAFSMTRGARQPLAHFWRMRDSEFAGSFLITQVDLSRNIAAIVNISKNVAGEIIVDGKEVDGAANKKAPGPYSGHSENGFMASWFANNDAYIWHGENLQKVDTLQQREGYQEDIVTPLVCPNHVLWIGRSGINKTDLTGKFLEYKAYPTDRTPTVSRDQIQLYPNVSCGYFGSTHNGQIFMIDIATLDITWYTTDTLFAANSWNCQLGFARRYQSDVTLQLDFPIADFGGKIRVRDFIHACYMATGKFNAEDITFEDIDDEVFGALLIQVSDVAAVLNDIRKLYRIEKQDLGDKLHFYRARKTLNQADVVATIDHRNLAVITEGQEEATSLISFIDGGDADRPTISVNFIDVNADFAQNQVAYKPPGSRTGKLETLNIPLVMDRTTALRLLNNYYVDVTSATSTYEFRLPMCYNFLGAGDVVSIIKDKYYLNMRIVEDSLNADWSVSCKAEGIALVEAPAVSDELVPDKSAGTVDPTNTGVTLALIIDAPALLDIQVPATNDKYLQLTLIYSADDGWKVGYLARQQNGDFETILTSSNNVNPTVANAGAVLSDCGHVFDYTPLPLQFVSGKWDSANNHTRAEILADDKLNVALYGAPGRWEVVQFQSISDGVVNGILRGCRGTEVFAGMHQANDRFVLANAAIAQETRDLAAMVAETYRAGTTGVPFSNQADFSYTPLGLSLKPWAPYNIKAVRDGNNDIIISWDRRDRAGSGWGANPAPQSDPSNFDIEIFNGDNVIRTINVSDSLQATYTLSQQTNDGFNVSAGLLLKIYQVSNTVGRGFARKVKVNV